MEDLKKILELLKSNGLQIEDIKSIKLHYIYLDGQEIEAFKPVINIEFYPSSKRP